MAERLDMRQRNNLRVGNTLAAEIQASVAGRRAFIILTPRHGDLRAQKDVLDRWRRKPYSKVLNAGDEQSDVHYSCAVVEVEIADLEIYLRESSVSYNSRLVLHDVSNRTDFSTLEELEDELHRHMDDLTTLDVGWRVIPWAN